MSEVIEQEDTKRSKLMSPIKWALLILIGIPIAWFAFCEARKAYWDMRVTQMCEKDGGVFIYEQAVVPPKYVDKDGYIRIPSMPPIERKEAAFEWEAKPSDLFYYESERKNLREGYLSVGVTYIRVLRTVDKKLMGMGTFYTRSGGDAFPLDHHTNLTCPVGKGQEDVFRAVFTKK